MDASAPTLPTPRPGRTRVRVVLGLIIIGFGLYLLLERHFGELAYFVITSESMEPTLKIGDRVLMERKETYKVGEIIVFELPGQHGEKIVKRIVAAGGDKVFAWDEELSVNKVPKTPAGTLVKVWELRQGEIFVAGDNRAGSRDSREYGPLPLEAIKGVIRRRYLSPVHWEPVK